MCHLFSNICVKRYLQIKHLLMTSRPDCTVALIDTKVMSVSPCVMLVDYQDPEYLIFDLSIGVIDS